MRYKTAAAFRQALEARLREQSLKINTPLTRLRKMVAFDRLLARLIKEDSNGWTLKGGLALQFRLGEVARTTKDIKVAVAQPLKPEQMMARLQRAAAIDPGDWFEFEIGLPRTSATGAPQGGLRFPISCLVDGKGFESFHLDLRFGDPIVGKPDKLTAPHLLEFADIEPSTVPCYPLTTQIAEKLHAYTRPFAGGQSSRVRDLVDILLMAAMGGLTSRRLSLALDITFNTGRTHELPQKFPKPPANWSGPYKRLARDFNLTWSTVDEAGEAAARFLNPVLQETAKGKWDPGSWNWR